MLGAHVSARCRGNDSEHNGSIPTTQQYTQKIIFANRQPYIFSCHRYHEYLIVTSSQHLFGYRISDPIPRNEHAKRRASPPILNFLLK